MVTGRLRPLRDEVVQQLVGSIKDSGLINPITIFHPDGQMVPHLVSGAHRLEAVKRLGWKTIDCTTLDAKDADSALLVEIDENLARGELSAAEMAMHTQARKPVYERLHPETKHGAAPGKAGGGKRAKDVESTSFAQAFTQDTAARTGRSRSAVEKDSTRAKRIPQIASVIGTALDKWEELDALARLPVERQAPIIARAVAGEKVSAKTASKQFVRSEKEAKLAVKTKEASASLGSNVYSVLYADPPWRFEPRSRDTGLDRAADNHYPTMTVQDICALAVPAADDAVLFLWATAPMLREAFSVIDAWGFFYKSHFIWAKDRIGTGYWARNRHELLLIATRGNIPAPAQGQQFESVIATARTDDHSVKPAIFAEMIEQMFPNASLLEMFARSPRVGWDVWGNESGK